MPKGFHSNHVRGSKHYRWSGGRCISSHGYVKVRIPGHSHADPNGYVYGHLLAWLEAGNQPPAHGEVIHHVNGDKQDNRIENLRIEKRCHHSVGHHRSVSDAAVRMIRELYASRTLDMPALAKKFGVPVSRISKFIRGETRVHAGGPMSRNNRSDRLLDGRTWDELPQLTTAQ